MKKFIGLIGALLIAMAGMGFAQQVSIPTLTTGKGDTILVPINASSLTGVGAISLVVNYPSSSLTYVGSANPVVSGFIVNSPSAGAVNIAWFDATTTNPINMSSGTLVDLMFVYNGGNGNLTFNTAQCSVVNEQATGISVTYQNGSVSAVPVVLTLGNVKGSTGAAVSVPLSVQNLNGVGAISLKIAYNQGVATFDSVSGAPAGVTFTSSAASGVLTLAWFDATGNHPLHFGNGTLANLVFTYNSGATSLQFNTSQCQVADSTGGSVIVTYNNGNITPAAGQGLGMSIDTVHAQAGSLVSVPLRVQNFNGVGAISLKINYNAAVATLDSITGLPSGVTLTSNASGGVLTIGWFDATGTHPLHLGTIKFANLVFTYNGGSSALSFQTSQCQLSDSTGTTLYATFTDGEIALQTKPHFTPLQAQTVGLGDTLKFTVSAVDSDGSTLTYSATGLPTGATFTASTRTFLWVPAYTTKVGSYTVTFKATAPSGLYDSLLVTINVANTPHNPSITHETPLVLTRVKINSPFTFSITAVDPAPNDKINYYWSVNSSIKQSGSDSSFTYTFSTLGFDTVQVTVKDLGGLTASYAWAFQVVTAIHELPGVPKEFALGQNYPNPFNPTTTISFDVPKFSAVKIVVYDILGRAVRTLVTQNMTAGSYTAQWDGLNDAGQQVSSGIYFYRMNAGSFVSMKKMIYLK